jgi:hypothetical protein
MSALSSNGRYIETVGTLAHRRLLVRSCTTSTSTYISYYVRSTRVQYYSTSSSSTMLLLVLYGQNHNLPTGTVRPLRAGMVSMVGMGRVVTQ